MSGHANGHCASDRPVRGHGHHEHEHGRGEHGHCVNDVDANVHGRENDPAA